MLTKPAMALRNSCQPTSGTRCSPVRGGAGFGPSAPLCVTKACCGRALAGLRGCVQPPTLDCHRPSVRPIAHRRRLVHSAVARTSTHHDVAADLRPALLRGPPGRQPPRPPDDCGCASPLRRRCQDRGGCRPGSGMCRPAAGAWGGAVGTAGQAHGCFLRRFMRPDRRCSHPCISPPWAQQAGTCAPPAPPPRAVGPAGPG